MRHYTAHIKYLSMYKGYINDDTQDRLKAVIENERAEFYLNGEEQPTLVVANMKHGVGQHGSVGIFVDIGTEAFISDLKVECAD